MKNTERLISNLHHTPNYDKIRIIIPKNVSTTNTSYNFFAEVSIKTYGIECEDIVFDFINNDWFDANACSILGGIIHNLKRNNTVSIENLEPHVHDLFSRNRFFKIFFNETDEVKQKYSSNISCACFEKKQEENFVDYLNEELLYLSSLPTMTPLLKKRINERLLEIFNNAYEHGNCQFLYASGQVFPKKGKISFTLCNIGKTIRTNVNQFLNSKIIATKAIEWAVYEGNSTRKGNVPGGLGLSLIREFLGHNNGKIQIVSSNGLWEESNGTSSSVQLTNTFIGTIVNIEINILDNKSYSLSEE